MFRNGIGIVVVVVIIFCLDKVYFVPFVVEFRPEQKQIPSIVIGTSACNVLEENIASAIATIFCVLCSVKYSAKNFSFWTKLCGSKFLWYIEDFFTLQPNLL